MQEKNGGKAWVKIPGSCLAPLDLRIRAEKHLKRQGRFSWSKKKRLAEELLFVPYYCLRFRNPKFRERYFLYNLLVDGILGFCEFLRGSFELRELPVPEGLLLATVIPRDEAEAKARDAVEAFALRRQSLWVKEIKAELMDAGEVHYPYWVCYLETPKGIELLALNGITGSPAGSRPENILQAGISQKEARNNRL